MSTALFIKLLSQPLGEALAQCAWALSKPPAYQTPSDITKDIGTVIAHPDGVQFAWAFSDDLLLIHAEAQAEALDPILIPLNMAGYISAADIVETHAKIETARGTQKTILDIIPAPLLASVQTFEQMKAAGWFPDPPEQQQ
jgi:hypothetical protein